MGLLSRLLRQSQPRQEVLAVFKSRKYLAFDIETAKITPEGDEDLNRHRPLGIACAATLSTDGTLMHWYSRDGEGNPTPLMTIEDARMLVRYLQEATQRGYVICSWNGLGFDFDILAEESGMLCECRELALNHVDMMFHFFCLKGFAIALDKVCRGMGITGKPPGMRGAIAPEMWANGKHKDVLEYVTQDVRAILAIAQAVDERRALCWITSRGEKRQEAIPCWLIGREAMELPLPDVSWMRDPWPRSRFTGWTELKEDNRG